MALEESIAKVETIIIPNRLIYKGEIRKIRSVDKKYIINSYEVYMGGEIILKVKINALHPNCDPDTNEFCISDSLRFKVIDQKVLPTLENMFRTFNFDNCYYQPWGDFVYE
jgi:hypothetical protein